MPYYRYENKKLVGVQYWSPCRSFSVCRLLHVVEQLTWDGTHVRRSVSGATRKTTRQNDRAASARESHSDSFHDTIRCRSKSCHTNHFLMPCWSESVLFLSIAYNSKTSATLSTVVPSQNGVEYHSRLTERLLSDKSRFVFDQLIIV